MNTTQIILDYDQVPPLIKKLRAQNKSIVLTQGTFDMIHIGHGRYLASAKSHGDILFVGVDSDEKVRTRKGPERPVVPESERLEMLTHLKAVDYVVLKPLSAPKWQLIKLIKPNVLITTESTYTPTQVKQLEKICGQVMVLKPQAVTSTSAKLRRLQIGFAQHFSQALAQKVQTAIDELVNQLKKN
ncbi:MAG: adenylyltransferase/cytidyltransferase family protein [Patescibacteria group bacterium]|nr:adenylyltransferase/cytidyltransferase family protein [Patescibacteria group bacterium]